MEIIESNPRKFVIRSISNYTDRLQNCGKQQNILTGGHSREY